jgi:hypothetical protein
MRMAFFGEQPESKCQSCGKTLNSYAHAKPVTPSPGDISVCGYCGSVLKYGSDLKLTKADSLDLDGIEKTDPDLYNEIMEARAFIMRLNTRQ